MMISSSLINNPEVLQIRRIVATKNLITGNNLITANIVRNLVILNVINSVM